MQPEILIEEESRLSDFNENSNLKSSRSSFELPNSVLKYITEKNQINKSQKLLNSKKFFSSHQHLKVRWR
jgi:hypothetical protein